MNLGNLISTGTILLVALLATPSFADEMENSSDSPTMKSSSTTPSTTPATPTATTPSSPTSMSKTGKSMPPKSTKSMTKWNDEATLVSHLNTHVTYPATGEQLIQSCNNLTDVDSMDKKNFTTKIEKMGKGKTYASAQEVLNSVNK